MPAKRKIYTVIGLMSGTSLDGVDVAYCTFWKEKKWRYSVIHAQTIPYSAAQKNKLKKLETANAATFCEEHALYGHYLGAIVKKFTRKHHIQPQFIASHGHTIFHQPHKKLTYQIGCGAAIAATSGLPVVCDFRTSDVARGGQGAPLVPIGDELLFDRYDYCLNLGGFANISFKKNGKRLAYDICPVNIVLNHLAEKLGKKFDHNGALARKGKINVTLLKRLNNLPYYKKNAPKSLGKEWVLQYVIPILNQSQLNVNDLLATFTQHAAQQIARAFGANKKNANVLITGGGAYNAYLIECINTHTNAHLIIPDKKTIEYKEALIFAFLGVLRLREEVNCLKEVTGAKKNNIGGAVYL